MAEKGEIWSKKYHDWAGSLPIRRAVYDPEARKKACDWVTSWMKYAVPVYLAHEHTEPFCTEMVLEAIQTFSPIKIERLEDITMGLGGGFSGMGEVCGAVSGAIIGLGLDVTYSTRDTSQVRLRCAKATRSFCRDFKEKFGSLRCQDLGGPQVWEPGGMEEWFATPNFLEEVFEKRCLQYIRFAIMYPFPSETKEIY
ncbi:MAG TPA: C_GCAxxG_C_C family protein [Dehalococcoidia bacterium]|nr:C_GCAxxG_C_C family protein [Dehalococcoidia bacterium]